VPHHAACRGAAQRGPARAVLLTRVSGVVAQSCHHQENVPVSRVNADPIPRAAFSITPERAGRNRGGKFSRGLQDMGRGARAVVARALARPMAATVPVWEPHQLVSRGDCGVDLMGRVWRGLGSPVAKDRCFSGNEPVGVVAGGCATRETKKDAQSCAG
jgi:hypothetical protein